MDAVLLDRLKATLEKHAPEPTKYDCPKCEDRGYIFKIQDGYEVAVPCSCLEKRQSIEKLALSNLTEVFRQKTINSFKADKEWQIKAKNEVLRYINDFLKKGTNASLILLGNPGSGKTHLGIGP